MRLRIFISDRAHGLVPISLIVTLALLVFSFGACTRQNGAAARFASTDNPAVNNGPINNPPTNAAPGGPGVSYAEVVSKVAPAVVTIHSQLQVRQPQQYPFMNDPFFQQFFGDRGAQPPVERKREALGSGVIVTT